VFLRTCAQKKGGITNPLPVHCAEPNRAVQLAAGHAHVLVLCRPMGSPFGLTFANLLERPGNDCFVFETPDGQNQVKVNRTMAFARAPILASLVRNELGSTMRVAFNVEHRVLHALAQYLVTDQCTVCPPHRLGDLSDLAVSLSLPRLSALCKYLRYQRKLRERLFISPSEAKLGFESVPLSTFAEDMLELAQSGSGDVQLMADSHASTSEATARLPWGHTNFSWSNVDAEPPLGHTLFSWSSRIPHVFAHLCVLSRFEFFQTLLDNNFAEGELVKHGKVVELLLPHRETLVAVVLYMYTGRLHPLDDALVFELFETARKFGLSDLFEQIEFDLSSRMDQTNAHAFLTLENLSPRLAWEARQKMH